MTIDKGDYLSWYNEEINRYRDHKWRLASFSLVVSSSIVLFGKNPDTKNLISAPKEALMILLFIIIFMLAEFHTHTRLSHFRERRELLLKGEEHIGNDQSDNIKTPFSKDKWDAIYFLIFLLLPVLFGIGAAYVLIK